MLNTFVAVLRNGRLFWLEAAPPANAGRVIVTALDQLRVTGTNQTRDEPSVDEQSQPGATAFFARHRVAATEFRFNRDELYDR